MTTAPPNLFEHWKWISGDGVALLAGIWTVTMGLVANSNAQKAAILDVRNDASLAEVDKTKKENQLNTLFDRIHNLNLRLSLPLVMFIVLGVLPFTNDGIGQECKEIGYPIWYSVTLIFSIMMAVFINVLVIRTETSSKTRIIWLSLALVSSVVVLLLCIKLPFLPTPGHHFLIKIVLISIIAIVGYLLSFVIKRLKTFYDDNKEITYWFSPIFNCFICATVLYGIAVFAFREIQYFNPVG